MFRWTNKQPWVYILEFMLSLLSDYLWLNITIPNKLSGLWFILTQQYMGDEYCKSGHLSIFTSLKHYGALMCNCFQGFIFTPYIKNTNSVQGHAAQIFKVETLPNIAFKVDWSLQLLMQNKVCMRLQIPRRVNQKWITSKTMTLIKVDVLTADSYIRGGSEEDITVIKGVLPNLRYHNFQVISQD